MKQEGGFTLIELVVAMAIFGFMLIIVVAGFINIVQLDQNGLASRAVQQNARLVTDDIEQTIRTSTQAWPITSGANTTICMNGSNGIVEYTVSGGILYRGAPAINLGTLDLASSTSCPTPPASVLSHWTKLNDSSVVTGLLQSFVTPPITGTLGTVLVTVGMEAASDTTDDMVHSDSADLTQSSLNCNGNHGSQFCADTTITTAGTLRGQTE